MITLRKNSHRRLRSDDVCGLVEVFAFRMEKGNSSTQSNPNNSQTVTDNRVAAADGSIAFGAGGSYATDSHNVTTNNVQSADPYIADSISRLAASVVDSAVSGNTNVARDALASNSGVARASITAQQQTTYDALNFGSDVFGKAVAGYAEVQKDANALVRFNASEFTSKLAANAGDAPQAVAQDALKTAGWVVAGLGAAYAAAKIFGKN